MHKIKSRPGFRKVRARPELLGERARDWRSIISVHVPLIEDLNELVSLGDRYVLSLGAHASGTPYLMDYANPEPLSVRTSFEACALLSYATDSPVIPQHSARDERYEVGDIGWIDHGMKSTPFESVENYLDHLATVAEMVLEYLAFENLPSVYLLRRLTRSYPKENEWIYLSWPREKKLWRAIMAYQTGLLSPTPPGRLLNFWRAIEAVSTRFEQQRIVESFEETRIAPIWTSIYDHSSWPVPIIDAGRRMKRDAIIRIQALRKEFGSDEKVLGYLHKMRRGKAAHADLYSLEYDGFEFIVDQIMECRLFQYLARLAIERYWVSVE